MSISKYCVTNTSLCPHNTALSTCPFAHTILCYQHVPLPTQYCVIKMSLCPHKTVINMSFVHTILCYQNVPLPTQNCVINMPLCPHNTVLSTCPFAHTILLSICRQLNNSTCTCLRSDIPVLWHFPHLLSGDGQTCDNPVCTANHRELGLWLNIYWGFEVSFWHLVFL